MGRTEGPGGFGRRLVTVSLLLAAQRVPVWGGPHRGLVTTGSLAGPGCSHCSRFPWGPLPHPAERGRGFPQWKMGHGSPGGESRGLFANP